MALTLFRCLAFLAVDNRTTQLSHVFDLGPQSSTSSIRN